MRYADLAREIATTIERKLDVIEGPYGPAAAVCAALSSVLAETVVGCGISDEQAVSAFREQLARVRRRNNAGRAEA